ncbi:MAG: hypothetical protein CLLPBCKN_005367 [Chroococcidiopsis cubana SAG 39.79]|uniref:hypothetical protein n=1 Tax=Chroococcidiopsis cubana TaxID=171392 RepID=UPI002AC3FC0A|nr:hypothetical protein [Chroococcidiopsis cubana]MDZ4875947.1 hypothetical protein [Chroococcidiopsis cubana SAG 39.79]
MFVKHYNIYSDKSSVKIVDLMKISTLILAALGLGIAFGILLIYGFPEAIAFLDYYLLSPLGEAFLRLIQFVVVPIVFLR